MVRELCLQYERIDPVHELIPVRPVQHYMMGGVHTDHRRRDRAPGPVRGRRGRLREHQRRQPAGLQLAPGAAGVRPPRRDRRRRVRGDRCCRSRVRRCSAQVADERRRLERDLLSRRDGRERIADIRTEMQHTMEGSAGIYRDAESLAKGADKLARAAGTVRQGHHRGRQPDLQHRAGRRPSSWGSCWTSPRPWSRARCAARSRAAPTNARTSRPRRRAVPGPLAGLPRPGRLLRGSSTCR